MKRGIDYIGVGVGVILVDTSGKIFLSKRGPQSRNERDLWEFPGGSVEFGEKLTDALKREMAEEFGIEIAIGELLDVVDHILPDEGQHWISPTFIGKIVKGEPKIMEPGKSSEIGWFSVDAVPKCLTMITRQNLTHYRQKIGLPWDVNGA